MTMDLTAIDTSDFEGYLNGLVRVGELEFSDVASLVRGVQARVGNAHLRRLNIIDHGSPNGLQLGSDWITLNTLPNFRLPLMQLSGLFGEGGFVHLQHCYVGQNHALLGALSQIFGVPVYASTGLHNSIYRFNLGRYERCVPSGDCESDVARPK